MKRVLRSTVFQASAFALALLILWQILSDLKIISPIFFPPPSKTLLELYRQIVEGLIWRPLTETLLRMFYGWVLASLLGVVLGAASSCRPSAAAKPFSAATTRGAQSTSGMKPRVSFCPPVAAPLPSG